MAGRTRISLLVCGFALALAGCGSGDDGTIPRDDAANLLNQVEAVKTAAEQGECDLAQDHAQELITAVNNLPNDVDPEVAGELTRAATNLDGLASDPEECTDTGASGLTGVTTTTDTTEAEEEPTETTTTTTTAEEESTPEETTEEEPEEEPPTDQGQDQGGQGGQTEGGGVGPSSGGVTPGGGDG